ncbi:TIGR03982 family His-Xaa-Ser system protein [Nitrincola sp.]|uniref:TIGR03982 family His-Xaa-Ser system protein n=1 Tax=Nitrincola sp. TaxID=1926584 RepID=UPI003A8ED284
MKRILLVLNILAVLTVLSIGVQRFISPIVAEAIWSNDYKSLMFKCDHVMREHFIAKQGVVLSPDEKSIRDLQAAEIALTSCHDYDKTRKRLIDWGLTENDIAQIGLEAIETKALDIRKFVEIHEIRY